jgi:hypothetical protein
MEASNDPDERGKRYRGIFVLRKRRNASRKNRNICANRRKRSGSVNKKKNMVEYAREKDKNA